VQKLLLALICCSGAHAAVIRGVVLDHLTGRPLARSVVSLRPVEGAGSGPQSSRSGRHGQFAFTVSAGLYLVRATHEGFAPLQYGQKDWKPAAQPVSVDQDGSVSLELHLHRFGAIAGTVLDENEVGIPGQKVMAYRARQPLRIAASAITDDRGVYRIHGLQPGTYHVRTAAKQLEDGSGLLPTFHRESMALDQSLTVDVDLDQQAEDADIRPQPGRLIRVSGRVLVHSHTAVTVTLISDVGRASTTTRGKFVFEQLAPGEYELIAEADDPSGHGKLAAYREMSLDRSTELSVPLDFWNPVEFRMQDEKGNRMDPAAAQVTARRKNLDTNGRSEVLKLDHGRAELGPGRWEFHVSPPSGYYVASFSAPDSPGGRADGWNEVVVHAASSILIKLSSRPAAIHGVVSGPGQDPAAGAPVYLEAFDPETGRRLADVRVTRTDAHGQYRFRDLAPGVYRILSTFEFEDPDEETMGAAGARSVTLSEATGSEQALDLYVHN